ncbi:unnamed protein product [Parajaminaea phylloscopi]
MQSCRRTSLCSGSGCKNEMWRTVRSGEAQSRVSQSPCGTSGSAFSCTHVPSRSASKDPEINLPTDWCSS